MTRRLIAAFVLSLVAVALAQAEPIRTLLTKENRMPGKFKWEAGLVGQYIEIDKDSTRFFGQGENYGVAPYGRFGLMDNLAATLAVPFAWRSPDFGDSEQGLGDVTAGLELVGYQHIFGYPWVMPHAEVSFDTGDEEKGLGAGETFPTLGIAVGTTTFDVYHWVLDGTYVLHDKTDDYGAIAGSFIWDLSDQFSLLAEIRVEDRKLDGKDSSRPIYYQGGFFWKPTDALGIGLYGAKADNTDQDTIVSTKIAYSF